MSTHRSPNRFTVLVLSLLALVIGSVAARAMEPLRPLGER
jgi:hypothetical protein